MGLRRVRALWRKTGPSESAGPGTPRRDRGWALSVKALLVLIIACAAAFWAVRVVRETITPAHYWGRLLKDGDVDSRRQAAGELSQVSGNQVGAAVPALVGAIRDEDERVAMLAVAALAQASRSALRAGDVESARLAIAALIGASKEPRLEIRWAVVRGLVDLGPAYDLWPDRPHLAALATALADPVEQVRVTAAQALGELTRMGARPGVSEAPPEALYEALEEDASARVRAAAAWALGQYGAGQDRTTLALLGALAAETPELIQAADSALLRLSQPQDARDEGRSTQIVPHLEKLLASPEPRQRSHAAIVLGDLENGALGAIPMLLPLLREPPPPVPRDVGFDPHGRDPACAAALALGRVARGSPQAPEVASALLESMLSGVTELRRARAAEALGNLGPDGAGEAISPLLGVLRTNLETRGPLAGSACSALGRLAPGTLRASEAIEALMAALGSGWEDTRAAAVTALGRFGDEASAALPTLSAMQASDRSLVVKALARRAVVEIGGGTGTAQGQ